MVVQLALPPPHSLHSASLPSCAPSCTTPSSTPPARPWRSSSRATLDVDATDATGATPLHYAVQTADAQAVEASLARTA